MAAGRPPDAPAELKDGRVVASHGRQIEVEDGAGRRSACRLHGRRLTAVCGDDVRYALPERSTEPGLVWEIRPRRRTLERMAGNGRAEPVVANLTQLVAVVAALPAPDWFVVDRYLAGAAWAGLAALVVFNKSELGIAAESEAELAAYAALGYPVIRASARGAPGTALLAARLAGAVSVLVGQSGTGKSSLLNLLAPEARAITQEISRATEEGRHTTTHAVLHRLASGGDLIDSPGVRDYAPPPPAVRDVATGFVELQAAAAGCRFQDCRHDAEPGCAVGAAVLAGTIRRRRFDSYRHLVTLAREHEARYPQRRDSRGARPRIR